MRFTRSLKRQTVGQTERMNRIAEQMLRCYVNDRQNDWDVYPAHAGARLQQLRAGVRRAPHNYTSTMAAARPTRCRAPSPRRVSTCHPRTTSPCTTRRLSTHRPALCASSAAAAQAAPALQALSRGAETGPWAPQGGGRAPRLLNVVHHDALRRAQEPSAPLQRCCSAAGEPAVGLRGACTGSPATCCRASGLPHIMRLSSMGRHAPSLRPPSSAGPPPWRAPPGAPCTTPSASSAGACARSLP